MTSVYDISDTDKNYLKILNYGFVGLVDTMPAGKRNGDSAIVNAARVSYGKGTKKVSTDRNLIRYLLRNDHTSPFEMVEFKFHLKIPIFVSRQLVRHRTASINEWSGRYSEMTDEFYLPELKDIKKQSNDNKQGRDGEISNFNKKGVLWVLNTAHENAYNAYKTLLGEEITDFYDLYSVIDEEDHDSRILDEDFKNVGIAKELARIVMPVSNYTELYWKIDLNNLFRFLRLRLDHHAQYEIRVLAQAIYDLAKPYCPLAFEAFEDYKLNSATFYGEELELIKNLFSKEDMKEIRSKLEKTLSKREIEEFLIKIGK